MPKRTYSAAEVEALEKERLIPQEAPFGMHGELPGFRIPPKKRTFSKEEVDAIEQKLGRPLYSAGETTAAHALKGLAHGFTPQLYGIGNVVNQQHLSPQEAQAMGVTEEYLGEDMPAAQAYREGRDTYAQRERDAAKDNPNSATLGTMMGLAALPKGAPIAQGAVLGAGYSDADLLEGEFDSFMKDTALGAATGLVSEAIPLGVDPLMAKFEDYLRQRAANRAVKAVTGQNTPVFRTKIAKVTKQGAGDVDKVDKRIRKEGDRYLDEGIIGPFDKVENIAPKAAKARRKYANEMQTVANEVDGLIETSVDLSNVASGLRAYAANKIPRTVRGNDLKDRLLKEADNFDSIGRVSFGEAQQMKNDFVYKMQDADAFVSNKKAVNHVNKLIGDEMDATVKQLESFIDEPILKAKLAQWKDAKSKYGTFKGAADATTDRVIKNKMNRLISPSDYGIGTAAAIAQSASDGHIDPSSIATGAAFGLMNNLLRTRGSAMAARGIRGGIAGAKSIRKNANLPAMANPIAVKESREYLEQKYGDAPVQTMVDAFIPVDKIANSKFMPYLAEKAAEGPQSLAIAHYMLSGQDPEYQALINNGSEEDGE